MAPKGGKEETAAISTKRLSFTETWKKDKEEVSERDEKRVI